MNRWLMFFCLIPGLVCADKINVTQVLFEEIEPGISPYQTRVLVNKRFLRFDDGNDNGDFVLFDRVKGEIHNFNLNERTEIIIQRRPYIDLDEKLDVQVIAKPLKNAPTVAGIEAVEHFFLVDNKLCRKSINFKGLMKNVTAAMIQYQELLTEQSKQTFDMVPADYRTPCYLANNFLNTTDYLLAGFPAVVSDESGRQKKLMGFSSVSIPASLFERPQGFDVFYPGDDR